MLKMAYFHAYWALFCIKVALVTDVWLTILIQYNAMHPAIAA